MRATYISIFVVTVFLGWAFFGWIGDFNVYVVNRDGSRWIKQHATLSDAVLFGFVIALVFAAFETALLWLWSKLVNRRRQPSKPN